MRAGASSERLCAPLAEPTADAPAGSASGDDVHDDAPSTSGRPPSSPGGGLRGILRALRDPSSGPRLRRLLLFTSLREFKPSEPFLVELYEARGLSPGTLTRDVFPTWTHARLPALFFVCAFAARFGCRRAVILGTACGMVTVGMTATFALFACATANATDVAADARSDSVDSVGASTVLGVPGPAWARLSQVFAAFAFASHQAFLAIAFSNAGIDTKTEAGGTQRREGTTALCHTRRAVSREEDAAAAAFSIPAAAHGVKAATLAATCVSAVLGQCLARFGAPLASLVVITFATQTGSLLVARAFEEDLEENTEEDLKEEETETAIRSGEERRDGRQRGTPRVWFTKGTRSFRGSASAVCLALRAIAADPSVTAWCLWSIASAPTHAFVAANWQTLVSEAPARGDATDAKFAFGAWLAAQRAAAFLATLAMGAFAYGALGETERDTTDRRSSPFADRSPFAASASLGAMACFLLGAALAETRTSAALFVAAFVCVFEATSSVCAAAVGIEAGRAMTRASRAPATSRAAPERREEASDATDFFSRGGRKRSRRLGARGRATSLAFVFAALSACGYAVDVSTQGVTDLLSLDVRLRFETRAAVAAAASAAFLARRVARAPEAPGAFASRRASDDDGPSARLLGGPRDEA